MSRCLPIALLGLWAAETMLGWSAPGHRVIAAIAEQRLTPKASAGVRALLGEESMQDASVWADAVRSEQRQGASWHFINIPISASDPDPARFCLATGCVMSKVEELTWALKTSSGVSPQRTEKLKYLIHFVSDLHQPLHVGDRGDRGGNDLQLAFFGTPTNLHSVWDRWLVSRLGSDEAAIASELAAAAQGRWERGSTRDWALESYRVAREVSYQGITKDLRQEYVYRCLPAVRIQLAKAGVRLTALLNGIWGLR